MTIDVGEMINNFTDKLLSVPFIEKAARNPVYTSLLIVFCVMLIIMFIFRDADTDESLLIMCLRSGFWIFIAVVGILMIHNKILMKETGMKVQHSEVGQVFSGAYSGISTPDRPLTTSPNFEDSIVPVNINMNFDSM
jgi:hypothetical protein